MMRLRARPLLCGLLLLAASLTACGPLARAGTQASARITTVTIFAPTGTPAATPNVDATVGAAVAATVQALAFPTPAATPTSTIAHFTNDNWGLAVQDVFSYRGVPVVLTGRVVDTFQLPANRVGFLMFTNPLARVGPAIIAPSPDAAVKGNDYVRVQGVVKGQYQGHDATGASIQGPQIAAASAQVITREAAVAPAIKTDNVQKAISENGVEVTVDRAELAKQETRLYLTVNNQSPRKVDLNASAVRLIQNQQQYGPLNVPDTGYPQLPGELVPGAKATTVLVFSPINPSAVLRIFWDGITFTGDNQTQFVPFQWKISS